MNPSLSVEEQKLLALIKEVKYGEITVKIRAGKPVLVEKGIKIIKLEETPYGR